MFACLLDELFQVNPRKNFFLVIEPHVEKIFEEPLRDGHKKRSHGVEQAVEEVDQRCEEGQQGIILHAEDGTEAEFHEQENECGHDGVKYQADVFEVRGHFIHESVFLQEVPNAVQIGRNQQGEKYQYDVETDEGGADEFCGRLQEFRQDPAAAEALFLFEFDGDFIGRYKRYFDALKKTGEKEGKANKCQDERIHILKVKDKVRSTKNSATYATCALCALRTNKLPHSHFRFLTGFLQFVVHNDP